MLFLGEEELFLLFMPALFEYKLGKIIYLFILSLLLFII